MEIEQADQKEKDKEVQVDNQGQRSSDIREVIISKELVPFVGSLDSTTGQMRTSFWRLLLLLIEKPERKKLQERGDHSGLRRFYWQFKD